MEEFNLQKETAFKKECEGGRKMNRDKLKQEAGNWVEKEIISEKQYEQILSQYPKKETGFLLVAFGGLFIGLGFLTFIASNWATIPDIGKMAIILVAMLAFYISGDIVYRKRSQRIGISFLSVGLLIFGAGIFLTGQMYNYMSYSATAFLLWSLAGVGLFAIYKSSSLFILSILITIIGQVYGSIVYNDMHIGLLLLFLFVFSHYTYHSARPLYGYLFSIGFIIQALVLAFTLQEGYYWLFIYFLVLYLLGDVVHKSALKRPLRSISLLSVFILGIFQVFFLSNSFVIDDIKAEALFFIIWPFLLTGSIGLKWWRKDKAHIIDLVLFVPVFYFGFGDMLVLLFLFVFSIVWLLIGYNEERIEKVNIGTVAFLVSTLLAYVHLAWDFLDKSCFFFVGGILLFVLS